MSRCPWTSRTARPPFVTSHFYLDDFVQSSEDPNPQPLQHTPLRAIPEEGFRTRRGHGRGLGPDAPRRRKPLWQGRPRRRPRGRRADEQRSGPALHHGPSAQRGRRSAGSSGPRVQEQQGSQPRAWAGPSGTWGTWQKQPSHPRRERLLERWTT